VLWCVQTNNPRKIDVLSQLGVKITGRIPCQVQAGQYNEVRVSLWQWLRQGWGD
jgi:GTP cyclohydrolase II